VQANFIEQLLRARFVQEQFTPSGYASYRWQVSSTDCSMILIAGKYRKHDNGFSPLCSPHNDDIVPVWTLALSATPRLRYGGRFGRHNCGAQSVARRATSGGDPNTPID
jgi:hypothetical protein